MICPDLQLVRSTFEFLAVFNFLISSTSISTLPIKSSFPISSSNTDILILSADLSFKSSSTVWSQIGFRLLFTDLDLNFLSPYATTTYGSDLPIISLLARLSALWTISFSFISSAMGTFTSVILSEVTALSSLVFTSAGTGCLTITSSLFLGEGGKSDFSGCLSLTSSFIFSSLSSCISSFVAGSVISIWSTKIFFFESSCIVEFNPYEIIISPFLQLESFIVLFETIFTSLISCMSKSVLPM